ncbi:hypothetical protein DFH08DRAFT_808562 [Mycena albidolilacea]|uniref:Uncharacterized protein n=1 Tax=Mycena albidolilacea TaxID=1033008 RepID=A0AAD7A1T5_9AGAR|nr:hypothetical protein DFH08DRAFT_808562 [Mycena albidolilacea]
MSFCPSVEEINEDDDPYGAPSTTNSDGPDLPAAFHCADWSNLKHPSTTSTAAGPSHPRLANIALPSVTQMRPPTNTANQMADLLQHHAIPPAGIICDARGAAISDDKAPMSSNVQSHPAERVLVHDLSGHTLYSLAVVNSSTSNAVHALQSTSSVHQPLSVQSGSIDPTLTYLPGYQAVISPVSVGPIQPRLQDSPAAEPGSPGLSLSTQQF